jgi:hypothetical protein
MAERILDIMSRRKIWSSPSKEDLGSQQSKAQTLNLVTSFKHSIDTDKSQQVVIATAELQQSSIFT